MYKALISLLLFGLYNISLCAKQQADSVSLYIESNVKLNTSENFHWRKLVVPSSIIIVGSFGTFNRWFKHFNCEIRDDIGYLRGHHYFRADNWLQYAPAMGYISIGFIPEIECNHNFKERLCAGLTAYALMAIITNVTKVLVNEQRPDCGALNSFPSGHTATVFTGAELLRMEYGNWIGLSGYTIAFGVGFLRMYNNRHWLNDVITGAGVGILSTRLGYWLLPFERKLFRINPKYEAALVPYIDSKNHIGLTLVTRF